MRPDYYKPNDDEQYRKRKSKSSIHKEKKSRKNKTKDNFRKQVQDFLDKRDDSYYNMNEE